MATKGYDDSPPRNGTILFYTVLTLGCLVAVKFTLDSYFSVVMGTEVHDKILSRGMEPVRRMRERESQQLGPRMERAQEQLAQRSRDALPLIAPKSGMGEDGFGLEEVRGWTKLGRKVRPIPRPTGATTARTPGAADPNAQPAPTDPSAPASGTEPGGAPGAEAAPAAGAGVGADPATAAPTAPGAAR